MSVARVYDLQTTSQHAIKSGLFLLLCVACLVPDGYCVVKSRVSSAELKPCSRRLKTEIKQYHMQRPEASQLSFWIATNDEYAGYEWKISNNVQEQALRWKIWRPSVNQSTILIGQLGGRPCCCQNDGADWLGENGAEKVHRADHAEEFLSVTCASYTALNEGRYEELMT